MSATTDPSRPAQVATWTTLADRSPAAARVAEVDLVVVRYDDQVSVLYARCTHRGANLAEGAIEGQNLVCASHGWDYRFDSGVSDVDPCESLQRFSAWIDEEADAVWVDELEIAAWLQANPPTFAEDELLI